jgi:uncharacterized protein
VTTDYVGLVEYIVKNIVESPDAVVVDRNSQRHRSQTIEVRLDPADVGRVIGKGGKNIEAIRAVVKAAAIKDHTRVNVEVVTDDEDADEADAEAPTDQAEDAAEPEDVETQHAESANESHDQPRGASVPEIVEG